MSIRSIVRRCFVLPLALAVVACSSSGTLESGAPQAAVAPAPAATGAPPPASGPGTSVAPSAPTASEPTANSQAPDIGGGTTSGDVPDNAVFLTYRQASLGFSIQYVEGWQVTTQADGVVIRDKDSSETVAVVALPGDVAAYVRSTDLPALQAEAGYRFVRRDTVKVHNSTYLHVVFHALSAIDPVTNKRVPSTVDRYYVPGTTGLAIVSLSTPDGVDNVDAFRQMIESFVWG